MLAVLDPAKYPKARTYIGNLIEPVTTFLRWWLDRKELIPALSTTYLFQFARDSPPLRIDFDRIWWLENIFGESNSEGIRDAEARLFHEIEYFSRDARWYGYPAPLAMAHENCIFQEQDANLAREILANSVEKRGLPRRIVLPNRSVYGL